MKKIFVVLVSILLTQLSFALQPVTGSWADTSVAQQRTAYSIEVQNNFLAVYIYSYADDNSSTNPTWYIGSGYLTQNADGTASATLDLYTVSNNQLPLAQGNVASGSMDITFPDEETANITWNGFPGNSQPTSTIKKYWWIGTGTTAQAKRYAAVGVWQYGIVNSAGNDFLSFLGEYYDPRDQVSLYKGIDDNVLLGKTATGAPMAKSFGANGEDVTLVAFPKNDIYFYEIGGGAEYSAGNGALVATGVTPKDADFVYASTGVRIVSRDNSNGKGVIMSAINAKTPVDYASIVKRLKANVSAINKIKIQRAVTK